MADSYPIIPSASYFSTTEDNLVTPDWFNIVFTNINTKAQSNNRYTRPVQIASSCTSIGWKGNSATEVTEITPSIIKLKELGHEFLPNTNYTVSHSWTINDTGTSIDSITVTSPGSGYVVGELVAITGGGGSGATAEIAEIHPGTGAVLAITITDAGSGYTSVPTVTIGEISGSGAVGLAVLAGSSVSGFAFADLTGNSLPDDDVAEVQIIHSGTNILPTVEFQCQVTYVFDDGINPAETLITSAIFGLPCVHIVDGLDAVSSTIPLIHSPANHQPLLSPGGYAVFYPEDISLLVPGAAALTQVWTLAHGGLDKSQYIENATTATPTVKIPEVGKEFVLTLTLSDASTTSIILSTYDYGSFFFSSWGKETPVDAPRKVHLSSTPISDSSFEKLFPENNSKITVKWGGDLDEVALTNGGSSVGFVYCVPGYSTTATMSADVLAIMQEYGIGSENVENYSLVNINKNEENLIGLKFWATNMEKPAEILHEVTDPSTSLNTAALDYLLSENSVYLVKGVCPSGQQSNITVGPGAERYYIWLKHFKGGTYTGAYDRYAVLTQSGIASPIKAVFNKLPLSTDFRAEVVSANGSSYSVAKTSEDLLTTVGTTPSTILSVEATTAQYGVKYDVDTAVDANGESPVGYIVTYKEYELTKSIPTSISLPFGPNYPNHSTIYSPSSSIKIPASLNTKVMASVRAVMADGALSDPVISGPTTVAIPSDLALTGLSMNLGRHHTSDYIAEASWTLEDFSLLDTTTPQEKLVYYSFGRDTFIEAFVIYVHTHPVNQAIDVVLEYDGITDANDQKIIRIPTTPSNNPSNLAYSKMDLSIPVQAGTFINVGVQNTDLSDNDIAELIDFTINIYYSHGDIITVTSGLSSI